jgi:hypothetical protein
MLSASRLLLDRSGTSATLRRLSGKRRRSRAVDPQRALLAIRRAARLVGGACLPQAVALAALLQRGGEDPVLVLGCRRTPRQHWTAHAWVEVGDLVLEPVTTAEHAPLAHLKAIDGWVPVAPGTGANR